MVLQGFDPTVHTVNEFIEFCERLEFAEGFNPSDKPDKNLTQEMSSQVDPSGHSMGALTQPAKSSAQGKNKKHKHLHDKGKFCKLHHVTDHDMGNCEVLKAQACKMHASWEFHWSNYGHNYKNKHNNYNDGDKKHSKKREEVHALDDDDKFDHHIHRILAEVLPCTPKKKKAKNKIFNMDKFNKLCLSNEKSENALENNKDSDLGTESEGEE